MRGRPLWGAALVGVAALTLASCTSDTDPAPSASSSAIPSVTAPEVSTSPDSGIASVAVTSEIATAPSGSLDLYDGPGGTLADTIDGADVLSAPDQTPLVFLVKKHVDDWLEVYLPIMPNGSTGWVPAAAVDIATTDFRIEVSLDDYTLTLFDGADAVVTTEVGVGREDRPTPGGVYYVRELLQPPNPDGPYGPYAYGLSGYQPVLDSFKGGDPIIGIHGTNEPESLGSDVSSGCLRVDNDVITEMVVDYGVPLGTPVYIADGSAAGTAA
ncbi:L,D-transpeptidase [Demequina sp. NBRC 110057]|uniref:L,D-transpeptidase n=1 Tax=Demequina sp. NBRC 110057 TaxID=1570346 RepID=UPI0009FDD463|nr:L,D-transpeptidase [Demequina sp. NBRC 110057]